MNKTIRVLCVGNSFSEDMAAYIPELAKEAGISLDIQVIGYPGGSIDQQIDFLKNKKKEYLYRVYNYDKGSWDVTKNVCGTYVVSGFSWDYVVLQECSYGSGQPVGYPRLNELIELVKSLLINKDTKFLWQMTWPYCSLNDFEFFIRDFNKDENKMYEGIVNNVKNYVANNPDIYAIIPSGTSIKNAKTIVEEASLYRDNLHLSYDRGRYLASLTFMKKVFGIDLHKVKAKPEELEEPLIEPFIKCVENAIDSPFEFTPIKYE